MWNSIKRYVLAVMVALTLTISVGCTNIADDYHTSKDGDWLTEQVEKGKLTQEQADKIREEQSKLNK